MIILGLGSNVGDKLENLKLAIKKIAEFSKVKKSSNIYSSDAVLPEDAPEIWSSEFYNMAVLIETSLEPQTLLAKIKQIEQEIGRKKNYEKWSPRIIDIDILCYNEKVLDKENIKIPHAHLCERPFALWPLAEIAEGWLHPVYKTTADVLAKKIGDFPNCCKEPGNLYNTRIAKEKL